jgi:hypothetical protein
VFDGLKFGSLVWKEGEEVSQIRRRTRMNEARIRPSVPNPRDNHSRRNVGEVVMLCGLTLLDHQDQDTALTP